MVVRINQTAPSSNKTKYPITTFFYRVNMAIIPKFTEFDKNKYEKYVEFHGKILIIGYGSVGQSILPVVLRHIVIDPKNITVLERDNHRALFIKRHAGSGVNYVRQEILPGNYKKELAKDRKSTRLNSSHTDISRMPSSA